jgi:RNA-directed DNA polymerase
VSLRLTANDDTLRQLFLNLKTRDDVAKLLELNSRELRFYLYKAKAYKTFSLAKRSGGVRLIYSPANSLKIIQKKLNQVLHAVYRSALPCMDLCGIAVLNLTQNGIYMLNGC